MITQAIPEPEDMTLPLEVKHKRLLKQVERNEKELKEKDARIVELEKRSLKLYDRVNRYKDVKRLEKATHQLRSLLNWSTEKLLIGSETFTDEQRAFADKALAMLDDLKEQLKDYIL